MRSACCRPQRLQTLWPAACRGHGAVLLVGDAAYYERCKHANSPAMRDPNPTVVLIPGLGMVA